MGIVSCTACGRQVNHFQRDSFYRHPVLKVLICKVSQLIDIRITSSTFRRLLRFIIPLCVTFKSVFMNMYCSPKVRNLITYLNVCCFEDEVEFAGIYLTFF